MDSKLLGAGRKRIFPQHVSLDAMVRGYCQCHAEGGREQRDYVQLFVHTVDPTLTALLDSRRIDLAAMTNTSEIRFWVDVRLGPGSPSPALEGAPSSSTLGETLDRLAIPHEGWTVEVRPAPTRGHVALPTAKVIHDGDPSLVEFGVLSGSTLILTRQQMDFHAPASEHPART